MKINFTNNFFKKKICSFFRNPLFLIGFVGVLIILALAGIGKSIEYFFDDEDSDREEKVVTEEKPDQGKDDEEKIKKEITQKTYQSENYSKFSFDYFDDWVVGSSSNEYSENFENSESLDYYRVSGDDNAKKFYTEKIVLHKNNVTASIFIKPVIKEEVRNWWEYDCAKKDVYEKKVTDEFGRVFYSNRAEEGQMIYKYSSGLTYFDEEGFEDIYTMAVEDSKTVYFDSGVEGYFACYKDYDYSNHFGYIKSDYVFRGEDVFALIDVSFEVANDDSIDDNDSVLLELDDIIKSLSTDANISKVFSDYSYVKNWEELNSGKYINSNFPDFKILYDDNWEVFVDDRKRNYDLLDVKMKTDEGVLKFNISSGGIWEYYFSCILKESFFEGVDSIWQHNYSYNTYVLLDRDKLVFPGDDNFQEALEGTMDFLYEGGKCNSLEKAAAAEVGASKVFRTKTIIKGLTPPWDDIPFQYSDNGETLIWLRIEYVGDMNESVLKKLDKVIKNLEY